MTLPVLWHAGEFTLGGLALFQGVRATWRAPQRRPAALAYLSLSVIVGVIFFDQTPAAILGAFGLLVALFVWDAVRTWPSRHTSPGRILVSGSLGLGLAVLLLSLGLTPSVLPERLGYWGMAFGALFSLVGLLGFVALEAEPDGP